MAQFLASKTDPQSVGNEMRRTVRHISFPTPWGSAFNPKNWTIFRSEFRALKSFASKAYALVFPGCQTGLGIITERSLGVLEGQGVGWKPALKRLQTLTRLTEDKGSVGDKEKRPLHIHSSSVHQRPGQTSPSNVHKPLI